MPAQNEAVIHPFTKEDDKLARFMVSKSNFQMLAVANYKSKRPACRRVTLPESLTLF
jgi:hypothetical protein